MSESGHATQNDRVSPDHGKGGYQPQDESIKGLVAFVLILLVSLVIVAAGIQVLYEAFLKANTPPQAQSFDQPEAMTGPAKIELLEQKAQLDKARKEQLEELNAPPSWVDREKGIARIPIGMAMEKLVESSSGESKSTVREGGH
ncbi:MAG: hypothetical protein KC978_13645 [Candidatus Omnitrophica bacterium]|nr:hypothetical protein [Candidatus Omnitrophota bacterium]